MAAPLVVVAVLAAAVLHAGWNAIAKGVSDRLALLVRMNTVIAAVAALGVWSVAPPGPASWPWLGVSAVVHVGYLLVLTTSYRFGDFNQTYPLARGLGPLIVAAVATLAIGERLPPLPTVGVLLIGGAVTVLGLTPWHRVRTNRAAVVAAVLTGFAIAGYTLLDGVGVRRSGSPVGYTLWLMGLHALVTAVVVSLVRRRQRTPLPTAATTPSWLVAGVAGVMSLLAYGLVLWAQSRGALAAVAALRESSVLVAAVIGTVFFAEPVGRVRIAASAAIAVGVVLLAVPA